MSTTFAEIVDEGYSIEPSWFSSLLPELAEMFTYDECKRACSYLPKAYDTTLDCKDAWIYEVRTSGEPEPICPFCPCMECNEAYSDHCQQCEIAKQMYWFKLFEQNEQRC